LSQAAAFITMMPGAFHMFTWVSTGATLLSPDGTYSAIGDPVMSTRPLCSDEDHSGTPTKVELVPNADHIKAWFLVYAIAFTPLTSATFTKGRLPMMSIVPMSARPSILTPLKRSQRSAVASRSAKVSAASADALARASCSACR
jgi:hypothetical protein